MNAQRAAMNSQALALAQAPNTDQDIRAQQAAVDQAQQALLKARNPYTSYDIDQQRQAAVSLLAAWTAFRAARGLEFIIVGAILATAGAIVELLPQRIFARVARRGPGFAKNDAD